MYIWRIAIIKIYPCKYVIYYMYDWMLSFLDLLKHGYITVLFPATISRFYMRINEHSRPKFRIRTHCCVQQIRYIWRLFPKLLLFAYSLSLFRIICFIYIFIPFNHRIIYYLREKEIWKYKTKWKKKDAASKKLISYQLPVVGWINRYKNIWKTK